MHIILLAFYETALLMESMSHCIISLKKDSKKILNKGSEASVCYTFEILTFEKRTFINKQNTRPCAQNLLNSLRQIYSVNLRIQSKYGKFGSDKLCIWTLFTQ